MITFRVELAFIVGLVVGIAMTLSICLAHFHRVMRELTETFRGEALAHYEALRKMVLGRLQGRVPILDLDEATVKAIADFDAEYRKNLLN